jgi:hypothetical protein
MSWGNSTGTKSRRACAARVGRQIAPVRSGSGVIEKNIEVQIARRFKRQGRSWTNPGAEHLLRLLSLQSDQLNWTHWWNKTALAKTNINPGWPLSAPPPN